MLSKKIKKVITNAIILSLLLTSSSFVFADEQAVVYNKEMDQWSKNGISGIYTEVMKKNDEITLGQLSYILNNLMKYDETNLELLADDLDLNNPAASSVLKCITFDIIDKDQSSIDLNSHVTNQNAWVMIAKAFDIKPVLELSKNQRNNIIMLENHKYIESMQNMGVTINESDLIKGNKKATWQEVSETIQELMQITGYQYQDDYTYFSGFYIGTFSEKSMDNLVNDSYNIYLMNDNHLEDAKVGVEESAIDFYGIINEPAENYINIQFTEKIDETSISNSIVSLENINAKIDRVELTSEDILTIYLDENYSIWVDENTFKNYMTRDKDTTYQTKDIENMTIVFNHAVYDMNGNPFEMDGDQTFTVRNVFYVREGK